MILGEHGDSMVPIWSSATVAGLPLEQWPGFTPAVQQGSLRGDEDGRARRSSSSRAAPASRVGLSIREVVHALALDSRRVLPVSTLQQGLYGVRDVCLSVPTVVGCGGVPAADRAAADAEGAARHPEIGARAARDHRPGGSAHRQGARAGADSAAADAATPCRAATAGRSRASAWQTDMK